MVSHVWWWTALGNGLFGILCGSAASWRTDRQRRRREARAAHLHRMSIRLVDPNGFEIMHVDCEHLQMIHKYGQLGGRGDWADLEKIHGFRLQTRPTFED
jgi:hypothetical protein